MPKGKDYPHLISDDPAFRAWYIEADIESRMADLSGRDHETVMRDIKAKIEAIKHEKKSARHLAAQGRS